MFIHWTQSRPIGLRATKTTVPKLCAIWSISFSDVVDANCKSMFMILKIRTTRPAESKICRTSFMHKTLQSIHWYPGVKAVLHSDLR